MLALFLQLLAHLLCLYLPPFHIAAATILYERVSMAVRHSHLFHQPPTRELGRTGASLYWKYFLVTPIVHRDTKGNDPCPSEICSNSPALADFRAILRVTESRQTRFKAVFTKSNGKEVCFCLLDELKGLRLSDPRIYSLDPKTKADQTTECPSLGSQESRVLRRLRMTHFGTLVQTVCRYLRYFH